MIHLVIITRMDSKFDGVGSFVKLRIAHKPREEASDWLAAAVPGVTLAQ